MKPVYVNVPEFCSRHSIKNKLLSVGRAELADNEVLIDKMIYFIDLILRRMVTSTFKDEFDIDSTRLKSTYLNKQIGRGGDAPYNKVTDTLLLIDLISQNPSYRTGFYSMSYGIKYALVNNLIREPLNFWQSVKHKPKRISSCDKLHEKLSNVYKNNISNVEVDLEYVIRLMKNEPISHRAIYYIYWVNKLLSKDHNDIYISPDKNGRIHHNLSGASRSLRPALTVGGKPIHCIDISSSQPYFAIKRLVSYTKQVANTRDLDIAFKKFADVKLYIDNVLKGDFYKSILNHLKLDIEQLPVLKKNMLSPFFGSRDPKRLSKERKAIHSLYPTVDSFIKSLKNKDYHDASRILQITESDIVIGRVAKRIIDEGRCNWFLTVHDSILCLEGDINYCRSILADECTKFIGYTPNLKLSTWTTDKVIFPDLTDENNMNEFLVSKVIKIERYEKESHIKKVRKKIVERRKKNLAVTSLPLCENKRERSHGTHPKISV